MKGRVVSMSKSDTTRVSKQIKGLTFTKNFRSPSAEEWYVFLPDYQEPISLGAAGKVIIHYNLYGNKEVFINTTIIWDDPKLHKPENKALVHALTDEIINRLVGYADTLFSVHSGDNTYHGEYVE